MSILNDPKFIEIMQFADYNEIESEQIDWITNQITLLEAKLIKAIEQRDAAYMGYTRILKLDFHLQATIDKSNKELEEIK